MNKKVQYLIFILPITILLFGGCSLLFPDFIGNTDTWSNEIYDGTFSLSIDGSITSYQFGGSDCKRTMEASNTDDIVCSGNWSRADDGSLDFSLSYGFIGSEVTYEEKYNTGFICDTDNGSYLVLGGMEKTSGGNNSIIGTYKSWSIIIMDAGDGEQTTRSQISMEYKYDHTFTVVTTIGGVSSSASGSWTERQESDRLLRLVEFAGKIYLIDLEGSTYKKVNDDAYIPVKTGIISGWACNESYTDPSDLGDEAANGFDTLLGIEPAVNNSEYIICDGNGLFTLTDVPVGNYKIIPLYSNTDYQKEITVNEDSITEVRMITPPTIIKWLSFNCNLTSPPFNDKNVRRALGLSIDRSNVFPCLDCETDYNDMQAVKNFIPPGLLNGGWADNAVFFSYNTTEANSLLQDTGSFSFDILTNTNDSHITMLNKLVPYFEALDKVTAVTITDKIWSEYTDDRSNGNFQLLRAGGWEMDSNNLLPFFRYLMNVYGNTTVYGYEKQEILDLIDTGQAAIDRADIPAYESAVIAINNILVEDMPVIPLCGK